MRPRHATGSAGIEALEDRLLLFASPPALPAASASNPVTIDLLAAYTPQALAATGSASAMLSKIQADVSDVNQAFANSGVYITIHLAGTTLVNYNDTGDLTTDLVRLQNTSDGYMDNVPTIRDQLGADLVALYSATPDPQTSDLAYLMDDPNAVDNDAYGYCTLLTQPVGPRYGLAQAIGFNLGATLDRDSTSTPGAYAFSYGYRFTINGQVYRDIMSRNPGTQIPYYSNPDVLYQGVAIGASDASANPSNVARALNLDAPVVAAYRSLDKTAPAVSAYSAPSITAASSDAYTFTVTYSDNAAINTSSLDSADILVTGPGGFSQLATFVSVDDTSAGTPRTATYRITAPGGSWDNSDNGTYTITLRGSQVVDSAGNAAAAATIGSFQVAVPQPINLAPGRPAGWSDTLPVSAVQDPTAAAPDNIYADQPLFTSISVFASSTPQSSFTCTLGLDGQVVSSPSISPGMFASGLASVLNISLGTLSAGRHTLLFTVDSANAITETSETDNTYSRTFTVYARPGLEVRNGPDTLASGQTLSLGSAVLQSVGPGVTLTIRNTGAGDLLLSSPLVSGDFQITAAPALTIAPGGSSNLAFSLLTTTAGGKSGQVSFGSNDASLPTFTINLSGTVTPPPPDLTPATPGGWSSPLVISTSQNATSDSPVIYDNQAVYLSAAWANANAGTTVPGSFTTDIYIDDQLVATIPTSAGAVNAGAVEQSGISAGTLAAGSHTFRMVIDSGGEIAESDETDNTYVRTFTIAPHPVPRLSVSFGGVPVVSGQTQPIELGTRLVGQSAVSQPLLVCNDGTAALVVTSVAVSDGFVLLGGGQFSVAPGDTASVSIRLLAEAAGDFSGSAVISSSDPAQPAFSVPLHGTVVPEATPLPRLSLWNGSAQVQSGQTPAIEFGSYATGQPSDAYDFLLRNDGEQTLTITSITLPDGFALSGSAPASLAPGAAVPLTLQLLTNAAGTFSGNATIVSNDPDYPAFALAIHGSVVDPTPNLQPFQPNGWSSTIVVATAQNTRADAWPIYDDQALYLDTAIRNAVAGAPVGAAFSVLLSLDGNVLATLAVSPATMAAAPGGVLTWCDISAGPLSAGDHTLRIDVDAGNAVAETSESDNSFSRTISVLARPHAGLGVAYQQNALANNAVAPVDAGSVLRGETAPTLTFTITNTGNATLAVGNPSIPAGFALLHAPAAAIAPGSSDTLSLRMNTQSAGVFAGNITFATNVPGISTFTIPVSGTVSNPPPPPLPNLALQTPAGFSSPLLVATSAAATADAARIVDNQAVYTRFGLANLVAGSSLTGAVNVAITLDGRQIALLTLQPAELGSPYTSAGIALGTLPAGAHTLRMQIDPQNTIAESDETDNVIERTFTVVARDIAPPTAIFKATSITRTSTAPFRFSVTYIDNQLVDRATIGKGDLLVTGPKKYRCIAALVSITPGVSASQVTATYSITAPGKAWDKTAAGVYTITLQARQVADTSGNFAATKRLGTFSVFAKAPVVAKASVSKAAAPPASATAALFASRPIMAPWWLDVP